MMDENAYIPFKEIASALNILSERIQHTASRARQLQSLPDMMDSPYFDALAQEG